MRTLESKKARLRLAALMNFVSVEAPAMRISVSGKVEELFDRTGGIVLASVLSDLIPNDLIQAGARGLRLPPSFLDEPIFNCESDIHEHILCVHGLRVKLNQSSM